MTVQVWCLQPYNLQGSYWKQHGNKLYSNCMLDPALAPTFSVRILNPGVTSNAFQTFPSRAQAREVTGFRRVKVSVAWCRSPGSDLVCSCRRRQVAGVPLKHDTRGHRTTSKLHVIIVKILGRVGGEFAESAAMQWIQSVQSLSIAGRALAEEMLTSVQTNTYLHFTEQQQKYLRV